eukprot:840124-Pyramimonas_sp.AAC.2
MTGRGPAAVGAHNGNSETGMESRSSSWSALPATSPASSYLQYPPVNKSQPEGTSRTTRELRNDAIFVSWIQLESERCSRARLAQRQVVKDDGNSLACWVRAGGNENTTGHEEQSKPSGSGDKDKERRLERREPGQERPS